MNVLIAGGGTGGHLIPALALADALVALRPDVQPVLIGAERGIEGTLLPERIPAYPFHLLPVEPLYRRRWWRNARWLWTGPRLLGRCRRLLRDLDPAVAIGTGGYAAGPMLFLAARRGVPLVLQEQNAWPGITTRRLARRARQIHLGFPEARKHLTVGPGTEVFAEGNPIVPPSPLPVPGERRANHGPVVFVMGGSQGAAAINEALAGAIDAGWFDHVGLRWATGHRDYERYRRYHRSPDRLVRAYWSPVEEVYRESTLVVARAGAMTTAELAAWGLPSILVPLPTAAADHQSVNARALAASGAAVHLPQSRLTPERLANEIRRLLDDAAARDRMVRAALERGRPDAAREIAARITELLR